MTVPVVLPASSINLPAERLGLAPDRLQPLARRLIEYGSGAEAVARGEGGNVRIRLGDYSVPIHQFDDTMAATKADRERTGWFWARNYPSGWSLDQATGGNCPIGQRVPAHAGLKAGTGNDQFVIVEDRPGGRVWCYWVFRQFELAGFHPLNIARGFLDSSSPRLVNGGTDFHRPFEGGIQRGGRGMGIPRRALVTTAEEIASGAVNHAAAMAICSTWWGDSKPGREGVDWLLPAMKLEWAAGQKNRRMDPSWRPNTVLEGLRIWNPRYSADRNLIEAWLDEHVEGEMADFWRIVLTQWCVYGFVVSETTNYGMAVDFDGMYGPGRAVYEDFGFDLEQLPRHTQEDLAKAFLRETVDDWVVAAPAA